MNNLFSSNNKKLGRICSFSIPTTTCNQEKAKEQGCIKYCYAKKLEKLRPNVNKKYKQNLKETIKQTFEKKINEELEYHGKYIRIHVSGDFYNQEYLNKWINIANKNKDKIFLAFTKNTKLNYKKRPKNLIIKLSDDKRIWQNKHNDYDGIATIGTTKEKKWKQCPEFCETCKICWTNKNIKIKFKKK